jgi:cadmium resistance protein CadD (predicted permease)
VRKETQSLVGVGMFFGAYILVAVVLYIGSVELIEEYPNMIGLMCVFFVTLGIGMLVERGEGPKQ